MRTSKRVYNWLKRFDAGDPGSLRDLPRSGRPANVPRKMTYRITSRMDQDRFRPREPLLLVGAEAGARLHITLIGMIMCECGLALRVMQKIRISMPARGQSEVGSTVSVNWPHAWRRKDLPSRTRTGVLCP